MKSQRKRRRLGMLTAQQMQERALRRMLRRMAKETEEEKEQHRQLLRGFLKENEENSSRDGSSPNNGSNTSEPRRAKGLVEDVMETYGFTREEAIEEIERFGG